MHSCTYNDIDEKVKSTLYPYSVLLVVYTCVHLKTSSSLVLHR